ncbi:MAG: chemotaxis protein CheX [Dehalococcoidia bacterium]|nr:MAG: chemotaxis protein CheX [bacterium]MCE7927800.1 chemotaxis protein CheX [Chloroflexi bacterium CFX7]MCK6563983.1 chemotaxis protein CheX [Dehalococcoidia bacterium]MCL4230295.1 chemotaxis protein CheX [Dehalococcoidia bacterium]NUQ55869.1 chemotaxis protein CheX [Dehalococcoidia bacterium]
MIGKVTVAEAARAASEAPEKARVELISPFMDASARVLAKACSEIVSRGQLHRVRSPQTSSDVSALIAITGHVAGLVIYSMPFPVACGLASKMIGEPVPEMDPLAQSAIGELANMITGQAGIALEQNGFPNDMSPPVLLIGNGSTIATLNLTRLVVPLVTSFGDFNIDIAIKEV